MEYKHPTNYLFIGLALRFSFTSKRNEYNIFRREKAESFECMRERRVVNFEVQQKEQSESWDHIILET